MDTVNWIRQYVKPYYKKMNVAVALVIFGAVVAALYPLLIGMVIDDVIYGGRTELLLYLLGGMIGLTVVRGINTYIYRLMFERVSQNATYHMREDLYKKLHELDFDFFHHHKVGDIMARMTGDIDAIRHFIAFVLYSIIENIAFLLLAIIMLMTVNIPLTLSLLVVVPVIGYLTNKMSGEVHPTFFQIRESFSRLNSVVQENISGNRVVKAFAREDYEIEKFTKHNIDFKEKNLHSARVWAKYLPVLDSLAGVLGVLVIFIGGAFVMDGRMTLGDLVVFNGFLWMLNVPMRMSGWLINDVQRCVASTHKIREMLDTEAKIKAEGERESKKVKGYIEFQHVDFYYEDDKDTKVLKDISFKVEPGQTVAILGATGAGKSTLVSLISRFYDATSGKVLIDHQDVKDWNVRALRDSIATVMQDVFLFSDSIEGNITFGEPEAEFERVRNAAIKADAHGFIKRMTEGYETIVGERGMGLSGGQKQRISLARALLKNPSILILDDTTSAVDMETEFKIQQELKKVGGEKTTFIIAHRVSSVKEADVILVLDHGEIIERGNHQELLDKQGYYFDIYQQQIGVVK